MSALDLVRLALSRLRTARLRAALTMLGVIIGVGAIVALVGVAEGTTANIENQLNSLGTNLLTVTPGFSSSGSSSLSRDDADAIAEIPQVAGVAPEVQTQLTVTVGDESTTTSVKITIILLGLRLERITRLISLRAARRKIPSRRA